MSEEEALTEFQDALLELLASGQPQDVILGQLKTDSRFAPYQEYISTFDPDMVAIACELMGKWAWRKELE